MAAGSSSPTPFHLDLLRRPRRLRRSAEIRSAVRETHLSAANLVWPLFVIEGGAETAPEEVSSMPGVRRLPIAALVEECKRGAALGIPAVALFPKIDASRKDAEGSEGLREETLVLRAVRAVKAAVPSLLVVTDVALDPYTSHGHDGVLDASGREVENDRTVTALCAMAVLQARAGADFVAPSDMMDGRIGAVRRALDAAGFSSTGIIAYSAKYASAFYGPFRDAVGSASAAGTHHLDKKTYQMDPANRREALLETALDEEEGADVLMIKPAGAYLDIIREVRDAARTPVAAYQVSGEYAMLHAAAQRGWLDLPRTMEESLLAIRRAGADMIFTYFAPDMAALLQRRA